ncbi:Uncharacterized protein Adt_40495 [Abeliophyllum distichum]|uniref:Transposase n=1 Tax=Abeliophyllum distichum TaxID=126358 RepID=A0ABD1Q826_9LAMI
MFEIKEQPIPKRSEAPTELEIMQEVLGKCRGYIRGLGHGPKPVASNSVDLTSPNTESIALPEQIEKQEQELVDMSTRLSQFESLIQKIVSAEAGMSSLAPGEATIFNMPPPTDHI